MAVESDPSGDGPATQVPAAGPAVVAFAHSSAEVAHALFRVARKGRSRVGTMLQPLGLHPGQEVLLLYLGEHEQLSQAQLTSALGLDHSTVAKMVRRMEAAQLVRRRPSASDRRVALISLTPAGEDARRAVLAIWTALEQLIADALGDEDHERLRRLLTAVEASFEVLDVAEPSPGRA